MGKNTPGNNPGKNTQGNNPGKNTPGNNPGKNTPGNNPGKDTPKTKKEKEEMAKINTPPKEIPGISQIINKLDQPLHIYSARTIFNNDPLKKPTEIGHISKNEVETPHAINLFNEFT